MIVDTRFQGGRINICTYFVYETPTTPQVYLVWKGSECGNRISDAKFLSIPQ